MTEFREWPCEGLCNSTQNTLFTDITEIEMTAGCAGWTACLLFAPGLVTLFPHVFVFDIITSGVTPAIKDDTSSLASLPYLESSVLSPRGSVADRTVLTLIHSRSATHRPQLSNRNY